MSEEVEIFVNTSNNIANALMLSRKLENIMLKSQLNHYEREKKKSFAYIDRHRAAFLQTFRVRRKDWWKMDTHFRDNVRKELDNMLDKKISEYNLVKAQKDENKRKLNLKKDLFPKSIKTVPIEKSFIESSENFNSNAKLNRKEKLPKIESEEKIPKIINHFSTGNQQQIEEPIRIKTSKIKLPEIKSTLNLNVAQKPNLKHRNEQDFDRSHENNSFSLLRDDQIHRTHSVIIREDKNTGINDQNSRYTKLPSINSFNNKSTKYNSNQTDSTSSKGFKNNNLLAINKQKSRSNNLSKLRLVGGMSGEEEEFFETVNHFLDSTPCYVENKDNYRADKREKVLSMKSIKKESKIAQSRDKRFDNLIRSLTDKIV